MSQWIAVVILGVIEGITEFLPVSSTGHLLIVQNWLPPRSDLFNIVIQSGAVLAVIPLFSDRLKQLVFRFREPESRSYVAKAGLAFFLTGAGGFALEKQGFTLPESPLPVLAALLVGGVLFLGVERWIRHRRFSDQVTWTIAVAVAVGQLLAAVFPGASRSGATILLALVLGLNRSAATEFSFLVGIPTMLAAGGYQIFEALTAPAPAKPEIWSQVALGFLVSAMVSFIAVKWLLGYIRTHTFEGFGWYRIVLSGVLLIAFLA